MDMPRERWAARIGEAELARIEGRLAALVGSRAQDDSSGWMMRSLGTSD